MDRGAWWAAVHGVAKSQTRLSDFPFTFHFHALEREMATHSSVLVWRTPGTGEPGGLLSMGSHRVGHDWSDLAATAIAAAGYMMNCNNLNLGTDSFVPFCSDFGAQENKVSHCFHCFLSISHEVMGLDAMILVFWMLSFRPTFSLSSFTFIQRLFSSSLSAIRVVSSAYLRLLIFFLAILIPAQLHPEFMMYSA